MCGRAGIGLAVLAPGSIRGAGQVVLAAVGVDHEDDVDLAAVDDVRDPLVRAVAVGQPAQDREALLDRQVLAGVVEAVEEDLGLGLVGLDVVGDLRGPDLAALVALADREAPGRWPGGRRRPCSAPRPSRRRCGSGSRSRGSRRRRRVRRRGRDGRRAAEERGETQGRESMEHAGSVSSPFRAGHGAMVPRGTGTPSGVLRGGTSAPPGSLYPQRTGPNSGPADPRRIDECVRSTEPAAP